MKCVVKNIVSGVRSYLAPSGPGLVLDFEKIILPFRDHSSKNQKPKSQRLDEGHRVQDGNFLLVL